MGVDLFFAHALKPRETINVLMFTRSLSGVVVTPLTNYPGGRFLANSPHDTILLVAASVDRVCLVYR